MIIGVFLQAGYQERLPMVKYVVRLTEEERTALTEVIGKGKAAARKIKHANVLLKLDAGGPGWSDAQAADAFDCSARTVFGIRQRCVETGLEAEPECKKREHPRVNDFWTGTARHNWCASPAPHPLKDRHAGPSRCWPTASSS